MAKLLDADRPVRWGILGAGGIASTVAPQIAESAGSEVVAVAARDLGRAREFAGRIGIPRAYGSYDELIADPEVDVVYVATTHAQHHEQALRVLAAGKPLLIEKAFTLTAWQAREVVAEARRRDLFCMEGMWMRLHPLIVKTRELAASGRIGEVVGVRADLSKVFPYSPSHRLFDLGAGGGALLDLGVYPVNFAWLILGAPDLMQVTGALAPTGADLTVAMQWGYADGRFAQIQCSAATESPYTGLVTGTAGWIRLETRLHHPSAVTIHTDEGEEVIGVDPADAGFGPEIREVERCLRAGLTESPSIPLDETVAILELLDEARARLGVTYPADRS